MYTYICFMSKYISANFNCFLFLFLKLYPLKMIWYAILVLQNAYSVCVSIAKFLFGGSRIIASLILLHLHAINCKYLKVWHCRVSYFFL